MMLVKFLDYNNPAIRGNNNLYHNDWNYRGMEWTMKKYWEILVSIHLNEYKMLVHSHGDTPANF